MRTVKIGDLKARLSAHLHRVRQGEEVLVCDRNEPVARIVPVRPSDHSRQEQGLVARGALTPPLKKRAGSRGGRSRRGTFPTRSWSGYGGKNGKAGNARFGLLGHERPGSFVRASGDHSPRHGTL